METFDPQLQQVLMSLGLVFIILLAVTLVYVYIDLRTIRRERDEFEDFLETSPDLTEAELKVIRLEMSAIIASGIASQLGRGFHSTHIAADAVRIADEILHHVQQRPYHDVEVEMTSHINDGGTSTASFKFKPKTDEEGPSTRTR